MYRALRAILPRDVAPGTTGGQDIQNPVEHRPMVGSWSPDMRFLRRCGSMIAQRNRHRFPGMPYIPGFIQDLL